MSQAATAVKSYLTHNNEYPETLAEVDIEDTDSISYRYTYNEDDFCVTALYGNQFAYHADKNSTEPQSGPCDGHPGGADFCPEDSYLAINGYYCLGEFGQKATYNSAAVRVDGQNSEIPDSANIPGSYVGKQTTRDNLIGSSFAVSSGEVYCLTGWVVNSTSTVTHSIGLQITSTSSTNSWVAAGTANAATTSWKKLSGCITIPSTGATARVWTQNNGTNGSTAAPAWYQTAITIVKQN